MSIVRDNLMTRESYSPYCGHGTCMHRLRFNGQQFECINNHYVTEFPPEFIAEYKAKWNLK